MKKEDLRRLCQRFAEFVTEKIRNTNLKSFGQKVNSMTFIDEPGESEFEMILDPRLSDGTELPKSEYDFSHTTVAYTANRNDTARFRFLLKSYAKDYWMLLKQWGIEYSEPEELDLKLTAMGF